MKKIMIIGCFIAGFLLLISSSVSAFRYDVVESSIEKKIETTNIGIQVHGGMGIFIEISGVTDETAVSTMVKGLLLNHAISHPIKSNYMSIKIVTLAYVPCNFHLYITVNNQIFSYKGHAFLYFVWGITPIDN